VSSLPQLDPDEYGNRHLQDLVRRLHPDDMPRFVEKLTTQPLRDRFHTYRELLVGAHLRDRGFAVRYEHQIDGHTPDWTLVDRTPMEVIDVLTLHQRHDKDVEITSSIRDGGNWAGWITIPPDHIYRKLSDKAGQYSALAKRTQSPYVLAVYGEFIASIDPEDIEHVLFTQHGGWFTITPEVSGVIYCRERTFQFEYTYFSNPYAALQSILIREQASTASEA
jgi:hypothetical protein